MKSFVTGSYAYGKPRDDSDIDLCVLLSEDDLDKLRSVFCLSVDPELTQGDEYGMESLSLHIDKLNLIIFTSAKEFRAWRKGTEELKELAGNRTNWESASTFESELVQGTVSREEAKALLIQKVKEAMEK